MGGRRTDQTPRNASAEGERVDFAALLLAPGAPGEPTAGLSRQERLPLAHPVLSGCRCLYPTKASRCASVIETLGGRSVRAQVRVSGAKNVGLAVIPALATLTGRYTLQNLPGVTDIQFELGILADLGVTVQCGPGGVVIDVPSRIGHTVPPALGQEIRASLYFLGALLAKTGRSIVPFPGGCAFPERDFDLHVGALNHLGFVVEVSHAAIHAEQVAHLTQRVIRLPIASRGVTGNVILACQHALDPVTVFNPNRSYEILQLVDLLNQTSQTCIEVWPDCFTIRAMAVKRPSESVVSNPSDRIEVGTFAALALTTGSRISIAPVDVAGIEDLLDFLRCWGANYSVVGESLTVDGSRPSRGQAVVAVGLPPLLDSDYGPLFAPVLARGLGPSVLVDTLHTGSIGATLEQLSQLGIASKEIGPSEYLLPGSGTFGGSTTLVGTDIRSTAALVIAGLATPAPVRVIGSHHLRRAYDGFVDKLADMSFMVKETLR